MVLVLPKREVPWEPCRRRYKCAGRNPVPCLIYRILTVEGETLGTLFASVYQEESRKKFQDLNQGHRCPIHRHTSRDSRRLERTSRPQCDLPSGPHSHYPFARDSVPYDGH